MSTLPKKRTGGLGSDVATTGMECIRPHDVGKNSLTQLQSTFLAGGTQ